MKYARTFLLVCALGLLLVNGPARAQNSTKPKVPICGSWDVVPSPNPNGNCYLTAVASVPGAMTPCARLSASRHGTPRCWKRSRT